MGLDVEMASLVCNKISISQVIYQILKKEEGPYQNPFSITRLCKSLSRDLKLLSRRWTLNFVLFKSLNIVDDRSTIGTSKFVNAMP